MRVVFPFTAIVGQEEMKLALLIAAVDPSVGGVLVFGDRGTGKSTAVRALAALLPKMKAIVGCPYGCDPATPGTHCYSCRERVANGETLKSKQIPVPVVDLPLGATEDRVVGALDLERALAKGEKAFEPGLLARAHRGFLYIDEVNLLEDHLVDLLLDVAASGENVVEREGLSIRHPARFVLIGSGNPEEGELRPQLLDRFGLSVEVRTPEDLKTRIEVVRRRDAFEHDPEALRRRTGRSRTRRSGRSSPRRASACPRSRCPTPRWSAPRQLCMSLGTDGLRGELTLIRAGRALAALDGARRGHRRPAQARRALGAAPPPAPQSARRGRLDRARRARRRRRCSGHERAGRHRLAVGGRGPGRGAVCGRSRRSGRHRAARPCRPGARPLARPCCANSCPTACRCAGCRCTSPTPACSAGSISPRRCRPAGRWPSRACSPTSMAAS